MVFAIAEIRQFGPCPSLSAGYTAASSSLLNRGSSWLLDHSQDHEQQDSPLEIGDLISSFALIGIALLPTEKTSDNPLPVG